MSAIRRSDVVLVVIDGETGIHRKDKHVAGYAHEAGKGVIIVYNKWDAVEKDERTMIKIGKRNLCTFPIFELCTDRFCICIKKTTHSYTASDD